MELRSRADRLQLSNTRLVTAADDERRRIVSNLHDGLQVRLVLLAMRSDSAHAGQNPTAEDVAYLHAGLQEAISDLRALVHGMAPAALTERGLYAAAQELTGEVAMPVELVLDRPAGRLPGSVESTGYFVISEALANAVKHAHARELTIRLAQGDDRLRIEVSDDGIGGARGDGGGLRGMSDRVGALGGRLRVHSPRGGGTRVIAEVPCAS